MTKHLSIAPLALAALLSTGCGPLGGGLLAILIAAAASDGGEYAEPYAIPQEFYGVKDARITGEIGAVTGDADAQVSGTRYDDATYKHDSLVVEAFLGDQWIMVGLEVTGGLDHAAFASGQPVRFGFGGVADDAALSEVSVTGVGCSNTSMSNADGSVFYDQPADAVTIVAHDVPSTNTREVTATVELPDGQEASTTFTIPM